MGMWTSPSRRPREEKENKDNDEDDDKSFEAQDVEDDGSKRTPNRILSKVLHCFSPSDDDIIDSIPSCIHPLLNDTDDVTGTVSYLLKDLDSPGKKRTVALQRLYHMTDRERKQNRLPIICTTKFDAISALLPCLSKDAAAMDRRKALLLIANLAIPVENKAVILLGDACKKLIPALLTLIQERVAECYLAAACLFNLSYLEDAKVKLLTFSTETTASTTASRSAYGFGNVECTTLGILEQLIVDNLSFLENPSVQSVQSESVRWAMATIRNLVTKETAKMVAQTRIPACAVECLKMSTKIVTLWTRDSLEDASLMLLVHLASFEDSVDLLQDLELKEALAKIDGIGGIHEMRAKAVLAHFRADEKKENA